MPIKRIINKEDYPMVLDWGEYKNTHTKLPCKCQECGCITKKTIKLLDSTGDCYCIICGNTIKKHKTCLKIYGVKNPTQSKNVKQKIINKKHNLKEKYPMVLDWTEHENKNSKLLCRCENCGNTTNKTIKSLNISKDCFCYDCKIIKRKKTNLKLYGIEHPIKLDKFKNKRRNTNIQLFGTINFSQKNRELWQIEITSTKENLENYLKSLETKITTKEISIHLGFKDFTRVRTLLSQFDLYKYIDSSSSYNEKELSDFINSLGFNVCKKHFNWGEIDIFIPEKNIGFEYNGSYWHNDKQKDKNYHYDKVTNAQNEGIRLIHIWDYEWLHNQEQIKSYIKAQLGLCEHRIFARKCEIREIGFKTAKSLLEYHQQKATAANHYIGLYYENELVLIMLFGKTTKNIFTNNPIAEWEVKREVCKEGYSVVGGKSKVFNYFVKKYNPQSIVSYVDRAKFTGKSYEILGFNLEKINKPRYDWVYKDGLIFKKRQPQIYKEMKQLYNENKVMRIYDSGRYCFLWKK